MKNNQTYDRRLVHRRLIIPLTGMLLLLISGFSVILLISHQRSQEKFNQYLWDNIVNSQSILLARKAHVLTVLIDVLAQEKNLQQNLQTNNKQKLLADFNPIFKKLHKQVSINHFHFLKPDRTDLLRLDKSGHCTDRFILREAERTGKVASGLELEKSGFFLLMIAKPIYNEEDTLLGYIELGQEITGLLNSMHQWLDVELAIIVRKEDVEQKSWTAAMRRLGKSNNWDQYEREVLVYTTLSDFLPESDIFIHGTEQHRIGTAKKDLEFDNKLWRTFIFPLKGASGSEKGDLYIFYDITDTKLSFTRLVINTFGIALVLMSSVIYSFSVVLKQIDRTIQQQYEAILSREGKLNEAQNIARVGSWEYDFSANTISLSNELYRILGLHPRQTDISYSTLLDYIHPDDRMYVKAAYFKSVKTKKIFCITHRLLLEDGTQKMVNTYCETFHKATGEAIRSAGTMQDITEIKQIGDALEKSENRCRRLIETTSEGLWIVDADFKTVEVNESLCRMLEYSKEDILGSDPLDFLDYESRKLYTSRKNILSSTTHHNYEGYLKKSDGGYLPVMVRATAMRNAAGEIEGTFAFISDISERKKMETKVLEINEQLTALIKVSPDIICFKDGEGRWLLANEAELKLFELSGVDYKGKTDAELAEYSAFYREAFLNCMESDEKTWKKGGSVQSEEIIPTLEGGDKVFQIVKVPLFNPDGTRKGLVVLGHDITEHLKTENRLRQEIEANSRTTEIIEEKRREAEEANIALRVLLNEQKKVKEDVQQQIIAQLERVAFPYIELLDQCLLDDNGKKYLKILSGHLRLIESSFIKKLSNPDLGLTRKEILVADLVKQGKSTKEIAQMLSLRPRSVEAYRNKIRKKLHINNKKIRLEQYLKSTFSP